MGNLWPNEPLYQRIAIFALALLIHLLTAEAMLQVPDRVLPENADRGHAHWGEDTKPVKVVLREPEPQIPVDAQIVETPDQPEVVMPTPVNTKFLSDKTTRTDHETKAPTAPRAPRPKVASPAVGRPSPVQSADSKSPDPTVTSKDKTELKVASGSDIRPTSEKGTVKGGDQKAFDGVLDRAKASGLLLPPGSNEATRANLQALAGEYASNDHVEGVDDGNSTVLNADSYKYADFFQRVKEGVERHWQPSDVYLQRDPSGQLFGVKDRYTILRIDLDRDGKLLQITTVRPSGLDFMDDEAKKAFRQSAPFLNPPGGLADENGRIRFEFGFYFEIVAGKYRFNWRRL